MKRLHKEYTQFKTDSDPYVSADLDKDDDFYHWTCILKGPENTPYEGGIFKLQAVFTSEYPFKPPKVHFKTKIFHCNISTHGEICVDILKNQWSPVLSLKSVLVSICSLLSDPNQNDPLNQEAGRMFKQDRNAYNEKAREYTQQYAVEKPKEE